MDVQLQEYRPVQPLRAHVHRFWSGRFDGLRTGRLAQRVVPNGFVECIIHLTDHHCDLPCEAGWQQSPDYTLIGLQRSPYEVRFSDEVEVFAIRFRPTGFHTLFGVPLGEIVDGYEDVEAVLGSSFRELADRVRDEVTVAGRLHTAERFLQRLAHDRDTTYLQHAERLIWSSGGATSVEAVTEQLSIGRRQLERTFKHTLGMAPKQYMRISRLNLAQEMIASGRFGTLAEVAYAAGYSDQAHFSREFKSLVGRTPTRFLADPSAYAVNGPRSDSRSEPGVVHEVA